jgi:hypothetical protein
MRGLASKVSLGGFVIPAEAGIHIWPEPVRRLDTGFRRCDEGFWGKAEVRRGGFALTPTLTLWGREQQLG